jgi:ATP-dependent DNA helicase PIF1
VNNYKNHTWLCGRAILAPTNDSVNHINTQIQNELPGTTTTYKSIDTVTDPDQAVNYPTEFLNSLEPPGMPSHRLTLKVGSPIMLLRNIEPPKLCNGTRLCVKKLLSNVIEATILTGSAKGEDVFIPRIPLIPNDMPFDFRRLQFPVRLAFAMTINKAQGQSLAVAGVNLETSCFSHGQLYVACSRVGTPKSLYVFAPAGQTKNVVYKKALE